MKAEHVVIVVLFAMLILAMAGWHDAAWKAKAYENLFDRCTESFISLYNYKHITTPATTADKPLPPCTNCCNLSMDCIKVWK